MNKKTFLSPFAENSERKLGDECEDISASEGFRSRRSAGRRCHGRKPLGTSKTFLFSLFALFVFLASAIFSFQIFKKHNLQLNNLATRTDFLNTLPKAFIIYSGSMEPAIKTGSIILSVPQENYSVGEIVTFRPNKAKDAITHRIEARLFPDANDPVYLTSGDANEDLDNWQITDDQIIGKTILTMPYLGYLANFAKTPQGFILFVIVPATIYIYEEIKFMFGEIVRKFSQIRFKKAGLPRLAVFVPVVGAFLVIASFTLGFFSDNEISLGNILGASSNFEDTQTISANEETTGAQLLEEIPSPSPSPSPSPTPTEIEKTNDDSIKESSESASID